MALEPLDSSSYGVDIVSVRFDEDENINILWRETVNMPPAADPYTAVAPLVEANEGVLMVSVRYVYEPLFTAFISNDIEMGEVAFSRGRSSPSISRQ